MSAAAWPLQEAVSTVVTAAVSPVSVLEVVPTTPTYPFVIVGDDASKDWSTSEAYGEDITLTVHVWSQDSDREEMKTLQQQIYDVLHDQDLSVSGFNVAALLFLSSETVF